MNKRDRAGDRGAELKMIKIETDRWASEYELLLVGPSGSATFCAERVPTRSKGCIMSESEII
jgi:hypothetical protein